MKSLHIQNLTSSILKKCLRIMKIALKKHFLGFSHKLRKGSPGPLWEELGWCSTSGTCHPENRTHNFSRKKREAICSEGAIFSSLASKLLVVVWRHFSKTLSFCLFLLVVEEVPWPFFRPFVDGPEVLTDSVRHDSDRATRDARSGDIWRPFSILQSFGTPACKSFCTT